MIIPKQDQEEPRRKVHYRDLDGWLKFAIVISWVLAAFSAVSFLIGFFAGLTA